MPADARPRNYAARYVQHGWRVTADNTDRYTDLGWVQLWHPGTGDQVTIQYDGKAVRIY